MTGLSALSSPVEAARIGGGEMTVTVEATSEERADLAAALGIVDIVALSADLVLTRGRGDVIEVAGRVRAEIVQNCVVSLEPVPQTIDEPILRRFVEEGSRLAPVPPKPGAEVKVEAVEEEPPEVLGSSIIDLGAVVVEHFVLAIDPYPRAPDAAPPENPVAEAEDASDSPFAALAKLRDPASKDQ